jgi:hypothetical protein
MKITVMPMIGQVNRETRLGSLTACHAIIERSIRKEVNAITLGPTLEKSIKELILADRPSALTGKVTFIVEIELE